MSPIVPNFLFYEVELDNDNEHAFLIDEQQHHDEKQAPHIEQAQCWT